MAKPAKSRTARRKRAAKPKRMSNDLFRDMRVAEEEATSILHANVTMLHSIVFLLTGEEAEQRRAIDAIVDLVSADPMLAKRMIRIMDANPGLKAKAPDLYEKASRVAKPGRRLA